MELLSKQQQLYIRSEWNHSNYAIPTRKDLYFMQ